MNLAAVLALFDFVGWRSWPRRFEKTKAGLLRAGLPVFDVEVSLSGKKRTTAQIYLQASPENAVWQKERLWNLAAESIPEDFDGLVFADADVLFRDPSWPKKTEELLSSGYDAVQLFREAGGRLGCVFVENQNCEDETGRGRTGVGWALRRDFFRKIGGWYDRAGNCWGDAFFAAGLLGRFDWISDRVSPSAYSSVAAYCERLNGAKVAFVDQEAELQPHSVSGGRSYLEQFLPLVRCGFDPEKDLTTDQQNLLRWTARDPFLPIASSRFFFSRNDDDEG